MSKSLEGVLVKPAYRKESFTESQILEIAQCMHPEFIRHQPKVLDDESVIRYN